ncbi:MAG TPA: hypothetical protein PKW44_07950 [Methylophilaceae bacterium]|nr:hypothetical protein [Methylophilaceae bacterium]
MELLDSQWFLRMVAAGGKTPAERLLAVYAITRTWIAAPGIRELFAKAYPANKAALHSCAGLKTHLTEIATAAKVQNPSILASQLVLLLQGAIAEELRNPGAGALEEAENAARAVIASACNIQKRQRLRMRAMGGLTAASILVAIVSLYPHDGRMFSPAVAATAAPLAPAEVAAVPEGVSPDEMEQVLLLQRQIEDGRCPAPQLLALPQGQVTAYMNAINLRTPENPAADRENMRAFLAWFRQTRSTECYFPPSNGHTTVAWVKR